MSTIENRLETALEETKQEKQQLNALLKKKPDFGLGKGASLADSWEMTLVRKEAVSARIEALEEALTRVDNGTYGYCENCGIQINPERLEILPTARLCTNCAQKQKSA